MFGRFNKNSGKVINVNDIDNLIVNTTVKTIFINSCIVKVNPYLRGEIE